MKRILDKIKHLFHNYTKNNIEYAKFLGVSMGEHCRIYIRDFGSEPWLISLGNRVTITHGVRFINHDGSTCLIRDEKGRRQLFKKIVIGNNVFIGINSIILPGVQIGDNVVVAAGSVLTKSVPSDSIVGGNPAKYLGNFGAYKKKVLETYVSNEEMDFGLNYMEMIDQVLDPTFKKELRK